MTKWDRATQNWIHRSDDIRGKANLSDVTRLHDALAFFFFQAEDGIRDLTVTGVQTCALPISPDWAAGGTVTLVTSRSDGGGSSMISGAALAVALSRSAAPSNTAPRGSRRAGSDRKSVV